MRHIPILKAKDEEIRVAFADPNATTLDAIALQVDLSRERVRQRLILLGIHRYREVLEPRRRAAKARALDEASKVCRYCCKLFGPGEGERMWEFRKRVYCTVSCQRRDMAHEKHRRFTDAKMLEVLRKVRTIDSAAAALSVSRLGLTARVGTLFIKILWDVMDGVVEDEELQEWLSETSP